MLGEATGLLLGEDQLAVHEHVELALGALGRLGLVLGRLVYLGRETRSPAVIAVSDGAVVDLDLHGTTSVSCAAVSTDAESGDGVRPSRVATGERLGGFIYGTIVVLSVIVVGGKAYPDGPGHVAVLALVTAAVFWIAHVYAHALGHSVGHDERISIAELRYIARREASMIEAALPPAGAMVLAALGILSTRSAVWLALGLGLAVLAIEGVAVARMEHLGKIGTAVVVGANLLLGLSLVGLKVFVTH